MGTAEFPASRPRPAGPVCTVEPPTLFTMFLPPLLFEPAVSLRAELLHRNRQPVGLNAVGGTAVSADSAGRWAVGAA
ncbi:MAG TPA: hypothetical protein VK689_22900 [Armatimonadota bacterium]|nr:hypothetical protein [Armatimonadota bacterium]